MQKEANFMKAVELYLKDHSPDDLLAIEKPKSKKAIVPKSVTLPTVRNASTEEYLENVKQSIEKHRKLYNAFKDTIPDVEALIYRYDVWNLLSNISLSVHPKLKKEWGITYELFGAFYNVDLSKPYNSLFPDLEPNSQGNVLYYKPKKGEIVLANPPYTVEWIQWTIRNILDNWKGTATFYVVIPIWDRKTRDKLGLKKYPDFPEIAELLTHAKFHEVKNIPFYDGIEQRSAKLKDPVHVIQI